MNKVSNLNISVLAGIVVLKSAGMAKFMNENVAGVSVHLEPAEADASS